MTPFDQEDKGFIVDEHNNPVDYIDEEEDEDEMDKRQRKEGAIDKYVKNMYLHGNKKAVNKGVDTNLVKRKEGKIKKMFEELSDDEDEEGHNDFNINANTIPNIIPQYIPPQPQITSTINNNINDDVEMNYHSTQTEKKEQNKINEVINAREIKEVTKSTVNLATPSPNKRSRVENINVRTPIPSSDNKSLSNLGRSVNKTPIDKYNSEIKEPSSSFMNSNISIRQNTNEVLPVNSDGTVYMYWYDAIEEQILLKPSVIFFGKIYEPLTKSYSSISLVIKNITRKLFILPKPEYEEHINEVYTEFDELRRKRFNYIREFQCKQVNKKYCFELPIDHNKPHTVLKAKYCADYGSIPLNLTGETFSYIFGKNSSLLENIILSRKLKGPCWIKVKDFEHGNNFAHTWSKYEITIKNYKNFEILDDKTIQQLKMHIPPLKILSLSTKTIPANNGNELFAIACALKDNYHIEDEKGINNVNDYRPMVFMRKSDNKLPGMDSRLNAPIQSVEFSQVKELFGQGNMFIAANETALISLFINKLYQYDPDIIVGHNLYNLHMETIASRINKLKTSNWSRISHFKREVLPKFLQNANLSNEYIRIFLSGRLVCDTFVSTREILSKQTTYDLRYLCEKYLEIVIPEIEAGTVISSFTTLGEITNLLQITLNEAFYSMVLMDKYMILPLTKQLTSIAGNLWIKSLQASRASRCEMLLLHEFHDKKYLLPDKYHKGPVSEENNGLDDNEDDDDDDDDNARNKNKNSRNAKRKPQYSGGLVLTPSPGLYDQIILLLDFNSLYPSIIQEYNLCFTTVIRQPTQTFTNISNVSEAKKKKGKQSKNKKEEPIEKEPEEPIPEEENDEEHVDIQNKVKQIEGKAILPSILEFLVKSRRMVKKLQKNEKDPLKNSLLEIRQKALKLTANSIYGYLGYKNSRFFAKDIASLITSTGRRILKNAAAIVQKKHGLNVIYGDTDSVMINTMTQKVSEAVELGIKLKKSINEQYRLLEMDIDGLFKSLLLLKKKKYASLKYVEPYTENSKVVRELKGLDLVRRDWSQIGKDTGSKILDCILSGKPKDDIVSDIFDVLRTVASAIDENKFPINEYSITKQLAKKIDDYTDLKALPHVKVAKRLKEKGDLSIKVSSYIPYVVCLGKDGTSSKSIAERSYHPKEIEEDPTLVIDKNWYKENQILSIIRRLVSHIEEISINQLCECLGIDSKHFYLAAENNKEEDVAYTIGYFEEIKVNEGISINCINCKKVYKINHMTTVEDTAKKIMICPECGKLQKNPQIINNILHSIKKNIFLYYRRRNICLKCKDNSNVLFLRGRCPDPSCKGALRKDTTEFNVAQEIYFVYKLVEGNDSKDQTVITFMKAAKQLKPIVEKLYNNIKYNQVDLSELMNFINK